MSPLVKSAHHLQKFGDSKELGKLEDLPHFDGLPIGLLHALRKLLERKGPKNVDSEPCRQVVVDDLLPIHDNFPTMDEPCVEIQEDVNVKTDVEDLVHCVPRRLPIFVMFEDSVEAD